MTNIINISTLNNINNSSNTQTTTTSSGNTNSLAAALPTTSSSSSSSSNQHNNNSTGVNNQETCLICGDVASGKHYGLRSCEACKAFFKRTVQGKIEYSCPATRECEINKRRRKACQACRFQKCLSMGMLKEGVRLDRVRGGRQKYRRGVSPTSGNAAVGGNSNTNANNCNNSSGNTMLNSNPGNTNGQGSSSSTTLNSSANIKSGSMNQLIYPLYNMNVVTTHQQTAIGTGETNKIMTALINCEPEELSAPSGQLSAASVPANVQLRTLCILSDLFDRELVSLIGWAKQIPGFSETITLNDQMRLLQSTWAEVIALSIGYRSHLKRLENHKQLANGGPQFMSIATPSPTSSSPASTTSSSYNHTINNGGTMFNASGSSSSGGGSALSVTAYNLEASEVRLVFAKDLMLDFKHAVACGAEEIFYNCVQLIKRLDYLKISPREYILLKAISLSNADVRLENPKATLRLRDLVMDSLYEVTLSECLNNGSLFSGNDITSTSSSSCITSTMTSLKQEMCGNSGSSSSSTSSNVINTVNRNQLKIEAAQERPPSSMNQYASSSSSPTLPSTSSSSAPASSSFTSSISPQANNNYNNNNNNNNINSNTNVNGNNITLNLDANKRAIVNNRMNQVLLCLPVLRQIDTCIRKFWNDIRKGPNNVPMNKLFEEMLEPCQRM